MIIAFEWIIKHEINSSSCISECLSCSKGPDGLVADLCTFNQGVLMYMRFGVLFIQFDHTIIHVYFRYFEKEQFSHSADKLALIGPAVTQCIRLTPGRVFYCRNEGPVVQKFVSLTLSFGTQFLNYIIFKSKYTIIFC